jgi:hypothetical protein
VDAVCVEAPAVHARYFIRALSEQDRAEGIAIERKKPELVESTTLVIS